MQDGPPPNPVSLGGDDFKNLDPGTHDWLIRSANRCVYFDRLFTTFEKSLRQKRGLSTVFLNRFVLANMVESYFLDIKRLKTFHDMHLADKFKIGGYSTKWLLRFRPIQFTDPDGSLDDNQKKQLTLLNPHFAAQACASICRFDLTAMSKHWRINLMYSYHYRDVDPGILAQMYELASMQWPAQEIPKRGAAG